MKHIKKSLPFLALVLCLGLFSTSIANASPIGNNGWTEYQIYVSGTPFGSTGAVPGIYPADCNADIQDFLTDLSDRDYNSFAAVMTLYTYGYPVSVACASHYIY